MSTAELKLINKITEIQDTRIIYELMKLINFELDEENFELSQA